jgi:hypothetical protein
MRQLGIMASWNLKGSFDYRILDYNPEFSFVSIDPASRKGNVIVEFHGFHNEATSSRMNIQKSRQQSKHWYTYWSDQFGRIWDASLPPTENARSISRTEPSRKECGRPSGSHFKEVLLRARCTLRNTASGPSEPATTTSEKIVEVLWHFGLGTNRIDRAIAPTQGNPRQPSPPDANTEGSFLQHCMCYDHDAG